MNSLSASDIIDVPLVHATSENVAPYGTLIGTDVPHAGLSIPFYVGAVEEGQNLPFVYHERAVVRTARIYPRSEYVTWLERHLRMTQLFVGLGDAPLVLVLGKPNHHLGRTLPDMEDVVARVLAPGHGVMLHIGTWHDFPMALRLPVTVLTMNSAEVVDTLAAQETPSEMDRGDVHKIDVAARTGKRLRVAL